MKAIAERLVKVEKKMAAEKGSFHLFALFLREDAVDRWDLVVASPWVDQNNAAALKYIAAKVQAVLKPNEMTMLSRIVIIEDSDPALSAITQAIVVEHGIAEVKDSEFFGLRIKHAYLITVRRDEPKLPAAKKVSVRR